MQQASVSKQSSYAARRPGSRLAWIGKAFLVALAVGVLALLVPNAIKTPSLFIQIILSGLQLGFVYAMIAARIGGGIGYGGSRYPYPFMDVDQLGWGTVLLTILYLTAFFLALGYVWVSIDKGLAKVARRGTKAKSKQAG